MNKTIIYSCPFVPAEWIKAHDMSPQRITPCCNKSQVGPNPGMCLYAHAFINEAIINDQAAAVIVTTVCDQMRRASSVITQRCDIPVFLMNVPHTWQTPASHRLYLEELKRLGRFLMRFGGIHPTPESLAEVMSEYDAKRAAIRDSQGLLSHTKQSGVPLALIGGPSSSDIFNLIEEAGGYVALDGTENGERTQPAPFDRRRLRDDPLGVLTDAYFGSIPDPFRRPNSEFYNWLKQNITSRGIRGIILHRYLWCDNWHAEAQRLKDWPGLPFLDIDIGEECEYSIRTLTRLQSFMEMLR